ncbi:oligosaccharide flippase family protein [Alphaproteobacteria bacterium]|nr:oligosaccharide flippase family protein [Alphaproteobacteria bacterium]
MLEKKNGTILGLLAFSPYALAIGGQIIFAKYLSVEEVGIFALINVFIGMILAFTNWNGDKYIISNKDIPNNQIDQVFTFEFLYGIIIYLIIIMFLKDYINDYLSIENSNIFWIALTFIFCYFALSRPRAVLEKRLSYFKAYTPLFFANILAIPIGFIFFYKGFGFWSMVIWKISVHVLDIVILWCIAFYIPKLRLPFTHVSSLVRYSLPIYTGVVLSFVGNNIDKIVISALLSVRDMGFYWLAFSLSHIPIIIRELIARFILPILAMQDSISAKVKVFDKLNGILQLLSVISAVFVLYWSDILIDLVLGEKWSKITPLLIILYFAALFKLVGGSCASLLFSEMKTRIAFEISLMNLVFLSPIMFLAIKFGGLNGAAVAVLMVSILLNIISYETAVRKFCNFGYWYYLGYLTINIASLLLILFLFEDDLVEVEFKLLGTAISLGIVIISLPVNNILKRFLSKQDITSEI